MGARVVGCRLSSAMWVYHSRRGKGKGNGEEKGNMGLGGGLIAEGKGRRGETGEGIKRE